MAYQTWSVVFGEQPSAAKWNILGSNDSSFNDGTGIDDDAILARHIADGAIDNTAKLADDIVTDVKLDYPRWWQELGRTTLGVAGDTITLNNLPVRRYLKLFIHLQATGGTVNTLLRFNNDSGANYSYSVFENSGGTPVMSDATSVNGILVEATTIISGGRAFAEFSCTNISGGSKMLTGTSTSEVGGATSAGTRTAPASVSGKWASVAEVTRVDLANAGTGDFAIGSEIVVLGHD